MVRPILALDRLSFLESDSRVGYRHGDDRVELERMDYLELIARVPSHIPDTGQVMVLYYGLYANTPIHASPGVDFQPPPSWAIEQVALMAAESGEYK